MKSFVELVKKIEDSLWELEIAVDCFTGEDNRIVDNLSSDSDSDNTESGSQQDEEESLAENLPSESH